MFRIMYLFLCIYGLVCGVMHFYLYLSLRHVFPFPSLIIFYIPFSIFMILSPILLRSCESRGWNCNRPFIAYPGYLWMGFIFLACSLLLVMDLARSIQLLLVMPHPVFPSVRTGCIISMVVAVLFCIYGYFEGARITCEQLVFTTPRIMEKDMPFRIVQISDLHLGPLVSRCKLERLVELIRRSQPDLIVSTGDMVDSEGGEMDGFSPILASLDPPKGKYAVTGNHEFYRGIEYCEDFTSKAGFRILRDSSAKVTPFLTLVGIDDPAKSTLYQEGTISERDLMQIPSEDGLIFLLKHRPRVESHSSGDFDLQLSGHIHGGQIFPFHLLTFLAYRCRTGITSLGKGQYMYVSPGTGTWGPPIRLLAPPKITIIDLEYTDGEQSIEYRR